MMRTKWRSLSIFTLLLVTGLFFSLWPTPTTAQNNNEILVATIDGPVNQAMTGYFERVIAQAEKSNAHAILIVLDTPGGIVNDTLEIVQLFRNADVPIIVYVGPAGAQAASAGTIITLAGHASGMAADTVIGVASPINSDGSDIDETAYKKVVEDLKAVVRGLTERRGDEVTDIAEQMIEEAIALTGSEAAEIGFVDTVARSQNELLSNLDGFEVEVNGETRTLDTTSVTLTSVPQTPRETVIYQITNILMNAEIVSLLLLVGVTAIVIEVRTPGGWISGFVGIVCIGLALYALGQLPANYFGIGLIVIAVVLFIMEAFTPTYGALAVTGIITMVIGLLMTFNTVDSPELLQLPVYSAVAIAIITGGLFLVIMIYAFASINVQPVSGQEGMIGMTGRVQQEFNDSGDDIYEGTVFVNGSRWRAEATTPLKKGTRIKVDSLEGLTLYVSRQNS